MVVQRFLVNGDALEDKRRFEKGEGIALDGIEVVSVFDCAFVAKTAVFGVRKGAAAGQFVTQGSDFAEEGVAVSGDVEARLSGGRGVPTEMCQRLAGWFTSVPFPVLSNCRQRR